MTLSGREVLTMAHQPVLDTGVTPILVVPINPGSFNAEEGFEEILDTGRRGPDAMTFDASQGVGITNISWDGFVRAGTDTTPGTAADLTAIGYLIANLLGTTAGYSLETIDTTNRGHILKLGTRKAYLTLEHTALRNASDRRFINFRVSEIRLNWNAGEGFLGYSVSGQAHSPSLVTAAVVTDLSTAPFMGWQAYAYFDDNPAAVLTEATAGFARLISGEWTLRRTLTPFYSGNNVQNYADLYSEPLEVTTTLVMDYSAVTDLAAFRANSKGLLLTLFERGSAILPGTASSVPDAATRRFAIGGTEFSLGPTGRLDNSNANLRLGLTARGLYTTNNGPFLDTPTAQNGPVEVHIIHPPSTLYSP